MNSHPKCNHCKRKIAACFRSYKTVMLLFTILAHGALLHADEEAVTVTVKSFGEVQVQPQFSASAVVISQNRSLLSAEVNTRINEIRVAVGDPVKSGQTLVRFDCRKANLGLENARARRDLARKESVRAKSLRKSSNIAEQNYNRAQTELQQAEIAFKQGRLETSFCSLKAPFDGIITQKQAALGELAIPGTPLLQLTDIVNLEVSVDLLPAQVASLQTSDDIQFTTPQASYPLTLHTIVPVIDPVAKNQNVRLKFTDAKAIAGASGQLTWRVAGHYFPASLLLRRGDAIGFFKMIDQKAVFHSLDTPSLSEAVAVSLPVETQIIADGRYGLNDGDAVKLATD